LDSSPGALDLTGMLSDVMAVEKNPGGSNSYVFPPMLVCRFSVNTLRISSR
jgi:hypothetical protein